MERTQELLDLVIGDLESELPEFGQQKDPVTCKGFYCEM
ncbi:hypothetical protein Kfla_4154 [Kribbella flavida DSM 17836]|uniref:Uncharacterized protein n=1 Tax=Kribbella flavida (strain DSM 17836 / JCM 10339 / NBRC 14399) TaxID=479435 RepID=D2PSR3_KRIFD|nr:hypothetical protein Kfla_4154 [Kribbella flavida DSM 17836]